MLKCGGSLSPTSVAACTGHGSLPALPRMQARVRGAAGSAAAFRCVSPALLLPPRICVSSIATFIGQLRE